MNKRFLSVAVILMMLVIASPSWAAINAFNGTVDNSWTNPLNWSLGYVPDQTLDPLDFVRLQSDNVTVDAHVAQTILKMQVGYGGTGNEAYLSILGSSSLTNSGVLNIGTATVNNSGTPRSGMTSVVTVKGDYVGGGQVNFGTVNNTGSQITSHNGTLDVDGGTFTVAGQVLNLGAWGTGTAGLTNSATGTMIVENGATVTARKMEINNKLTGSSVTVNDSTFTLTDDNATTSQLDGRFNATNSSVNLNGEVYTTAGSGGFSVIGGATDDLTLQVARFNDSTVISNVTLAGLSRLVVAGDGDATAVMDLDFKNSVTNMTVGADAGELWIGTGANSAGTLNLTGGNIHLQTSSLMIATGDGATGALNLNGGTITGVIGDYGRGSGASGDGLDLFNQLDSYGTVRMDVDSAITNGNHVITALSVAQGINSSAALLLDTNYLAYGAAITIASGAGSHGSLETASGYLSLVTNDLSLAMGLGATMTSDVTFQGVAGNFSIGYGADEGTKDQINHIETIGDINLNTLGLQITSGVHSILNMRIADTSYVTAVYTNDASAQQLTMNNLLISDNTRATGTFYMVGGSLNVTNVISVANAAGGVGEFIMTGGAVTSKTIQVGSSGITGEDQAIGKMVVTGGTITNTGAMTVGGENNQHNRKGELVIDGGASIDVGGGLTIAGANANVTKLQGSEGLVTISNGTLSAATIVVGKDYSSTGTVYLSHANAYMGTTTGNIIIGQNSNTLGKVVVDAGWLDAGNNLLVGDNNGSDITGILEINGAKVTVGERNTSGDMYLGDGVGANGIVTMNGGTLTVQDQIGVGQTIGTAPGVAGSGTFTANNAAITNKGVFVVANNDYTTGYVGITNSALSLGTVTTAEEAISANGALNVAVDLSSHGEMYVIGGSLTAGTDNGALLVGTSSNAYGVLKIATATTADLKAAAVNVGSASDSFGELTLNNAAFTNTGGVGIGTGAGSQGTVNLDNATFIMSSTTVNSHATIGNNGGTGIMNLDNGATFASQAEGAGGGDMRLGLANSTGTVNIAGGSLVKVGDVLMIGNGGVGALNITNATLEAEQINVGSTAGDGGEGILNIKNGATVNVGTTTAGNGYFQLGNASNTTAVVNMTGGEVNMLDGGSANLRIGQSGLGVFNLSGGTVNAKKMASVLGNGNGGNGVLNISGTGLFDATTKAVYLGQSSNAVGYVNVYGGEFKAATVNVGNNADGVGYFTVTGGVVNVDNAFNVGTVGTGTLTLNGGEMTVGDLVVGNSNSVGSVYLYGGLLTIANANSLVISNGSSLYMEKGILSWNDDGAGTQLGLLEGMIGAGLITGSNGFAEGGGVVLDSTNFTALGNGFFMATGIAGGDATAFVTVIPEPATIGMMLGIGGGLLWIRRRFYLG